SKVMAIAPSKLGRFVLEEGFSWPKSESASPTDYTASDRILVRRLRENGVGRARASDADVTETFPSRTPRTCCRRLLAVQLATRAGACLSPAIPYRERTAMGRAVGVL